MLEMRRTIMIITKDHLMTWEYDQDTKELFYIEENQRIRVLELNIMANGVRDIVISADDKGEPTITKLDKTPKNKILFYPQGDIALLKLDREKNQLLIFDINTSTKPMIEFIIGQWKTREKGKDFDMYGGEEYTPGEQL